MKEKTINLLSDVGLIIILLLQTAWFCNTYSIIRNATIDKCSYLLKETINQLSKSGTTHSLQLIATTYTHLLINSEIHATIIVNKIDLHNNITESISDKEYISRHAILLPPLNISPDKTSTEKIQILITNPYEIILRQMTFVLAFTAIMMFFVGYCIAYQIRIIIRQRKIAEIKDTFSYAMIHDMKTPIASLQLGAHVLRKLKPEETNKRDKYLTLMEEESIHLYSLANRVLTLAKLEKDCLQLNKEIILIQPIIKSLIDKFTAKSAKPVSFITHIEVETVYADKEYFEEIIANLIDNAIKYSKESIQIDIFSREKEESIQIGIWDNGLGIETKDIEKIFDKFERSQNTIKHQCKGGPAGFGLGLTYVKQMTEAHAGRVEIRSKKGEYSEFIICLPKLTVKL